MSRSSPPRLLTLILLAGLATLSLTLIVPSVAGIAVALGVETGTASLLVAGYLAVTAAIQIVAGPLSDRYGRRPVLLAALGVFAAASVGAALAQDFAVLLACRLLQGAVTTAWVVALAAIRDTRPADQAAGMIGTVSMAMAVAPMLGPMVGGLLDAAYGWRAGFWLFAVLGAGVLALSWADFDETRQQGSEGPGLRAAWPTLLGARLFWGHAVCMAASTAAFYAFLSGSPAIARGVLEVRPEVLGLWVGSITGGFLTGSFLAARLAERVGAIGLMLAGRAVACAGLTAGLVCLAFGVVTPLTVFGATVWVGVGNGLTMPGTSAGAMSVRPELAGSASGLSGALTVAFGAVISGLTGAVVGATDVATLLGIMLACSALGGLAALSVRRAAG